MSVHLYAAPHHRIVETPIVYKNHGIPICRKGSKLLPIFFRELAEEAEMPVIFLPNVRNTGTVNEIEDIIA